MRITGGEARGRLVPSPSGAEVRPTASKIRQALFNILSAKVPGCAFLDIFAGTGLIGLEALSRGAKTLVAVEESRKMVLGIEQSLRTLGYTGHVISSDWRRALPTLAGRKFDIIFADPPYRSNFPTTLKAAVSDNALLQADGVLVIEHAREYKFDEGSDLIELVDCRAYGQTSLSFFTMRPTSSI